MSMALQITGQTGYLHSVGTGGGAGRPDGTGGTTTHQI